MKQSALASFYSGFHRFGDYFILLLYLNFLWICFTLLGGILFGWAPSTAAVLTVLRQKIMGNDNPTFPIFWKAYRQEFLRTNGLGLILLLTGYILFVNIQFFEVEVAWIFVSIRYLMIAIMILFGIMVLYIFPLIVHYETSLFRQIKNALFMTIYKPIRTIYTVGSCVIVSQLLFAFPIFIPFLGVSLFALVIMWTTYFTFRNIEEKQEEFEKAEA
ncbi:YesL family protein [Salipaludibacillus sp. HK11]|uniref:YesL family protein n=1 Tax=Salipaludibacillus sp. HK11 TaxID=3394320 RepID=UPI0039FBEC1A